LFPEKKSLPEQAIEVACVLGAWGVRGALRVHPYSADPQVLFSAKQWYIRFPAAALLSKVKPDTVSFSKSEMAYSVQVGRVRQQGDALVATLVGLTDKDQADGLKGSRVWVSRASFPPASLDEYYWVDLIGLSVYNREGICLGQVEDLLPTGPSAVLVIERIAKAELNTKPVSCLIPFVSAYIDRVDLPGKRIEVDWPLAWENEE
jgi:16S rRNA processing protein RimM